MAITTTTNKMATRKWSKSNFGSASLCYGNDNKCITATNISNEDTVVLNPVSDVVGALPKVYIQDKYSDLSKCLKETSMVEEYQPINFTVECNIYKNKTSSSSGGSTGLTSYLFKADLKYNNAADTNITTIGRGGLNTEVDITIKLRYGDNKLVDSKTIAEAITTVTAPAPNAIDNIVNTLLSIETNGVGLNKPTDSNPNLNMTINNFLDCFATDMYTQYTGYTAGGLENSTYTFSITCSISPKSYLPVDTKYLPTLHEVSTSVAASEININTVKPYPVFNFNGVAYKLNNDNDNLYWYDIYVDIYSPRITNEDGTINTSDLDALTFSVSDGEFETFNKRIEYNFAGSYDRVYIWGLTKSVVNDLGILVEPGVNVTYSPSGYKSKTYSIVARSVVAIPTYTHKYETNYLAITAVNACTIKFSGGDIEYSSSNNLNVNNINNNGAWITLSANTTLSIAKGNTYYFKATGLTPTAFDGIGTFTITGNCNISGNIMSMLYGDNTTDSLVGYDYAFYKLFQNCTTIQDVSELLLPATTLADSCYLSMFSDCTSLVTAPELPATTLANYCYNYMFAGCTGLATAPELPATTLASGCYYSMFSFCNSLITAPELPATTLADYCYGIMFSNCSSLVNAPELPATTLANGCYQYMFSNCSSLVNAPELPATTLADSCYQYMFRGCSSLCYIEMLANTILNSSCLDNWVYGVSNTGLFIKHLDMTSLSIGDSGIPNGWVCISNDKLYGELGIIALEDNVNIEFIPDNNINKYPAISSDNGNSWGAFNQNKILAKGEYALFNGEFDKWYFNYDNNGIGSFAITGGKCAVFGTCASLLFLDFLNNFNKTYIIRPYIFKKLFIDCTAIKIVTEKLLPATTLTLGCYMDMFSGCTSLVKAPELPADIVKKESYKSMFYNCNITKAIKLPAEVLGEDCYASMFNNCKQMVEGPQILPAKVLEVGCYDHMFSGCENLIKAPELPATQLVNKCYTHMFENCNSLNYIKAMTLTKPSDSNPEYTKNWLYGVSSSGTFVANSNATWPNNLSATERTGSYIPSRWTIEYANN